MIAEGRGGNLGHVSRPGSHSFPACHVRGSVGESDRSRSNYITYHPERSTEKRHI